MQADSLSHDQPKHDHEHTDGHEGHGHGGLGHVHAPTSFDSAFGIGIALNAGFVVLEAVFGILGNSVALLADAGHNLSDALGLGVACAAVVLQRRKPSRRYTYGLGSASILAALFNAVFLLAVTAGLTWEAVQRFSQPEPVAGKTVIIVAACGIALNGFCAWLFAAGRHGDLNVRGAFLHMAADALVSLGVVVGGFIILLTGWHWVDPVVTLLINAVIVWGTWGLLTGSLAMALNAVPPGIDPAKVRDLLLECSGVKGVHDLHIWSLSTTETALTCHMVLEDGLQSDAVLSDAAEKLEARFGIAHVTLQPERAPSAAHLAGTHEYVV